MVGGNQCPQCASTDHDCKCAEPMFFSHRNDLVLGCQSGLTFTPNNGGTLSFRLRLSKSIRISRLNTSQAKFLVRLYSRSRPPLQPKHHQEGRAPSPQLPKQLEFEACGSVQAERQKKLKRKQQDPECFSRDARLAPLRTGNMPEVTCCQYGRTTSRSVLAAGKPLNAIQLSISTCRSISDARLKSSITPLYGAPNQSKLNTRGRPSPWWGIQRGGWDECF